MSSLNSVDLLKDEDLNEVAGWSEDPVLLEEAIDVRLTGLNKLISQDMMEVIGRLGLDFTPIPVSSSTNVGMNDLYSEMTRVLTGGERFTR